MRMIDADSLKERMFAETPEHEKGVVDIFLEAVAAMIDEQPTIEERKKGKWIPVTRIYKVTEEQFPNTHIEWVDATEPDEIDGVRCSECGTVYDFIEARNWCSECGADMRGDKHETD